MTYQSEYGKIVSLLVKHPKDAFQTQDNVDKQWRNLFYTSKPDVLKAQDDYEAFLEIFTSIIFMNLNLNHWPVTLI